MFVLNFNGVREESGADIAGVGARDGDDGGLGQLVENPSRLNGGWRGERIDDVIEPDSSDCI